ncbi:hypothetical protein MSAN_00232800 [Mycena sanguinolenta]|uniref:Uncharacterized protein n=1 Tax=Mycena sanguinolenta TaxID=230812 RepID=A0A8H7DNY1_9AGAR|nr:hypothetical protein MSAN_00232800 [Mycena sanguinolenta]
MQMALLPSTDPPGKFTILRIEFKLRAKDKMTNFKPTTDMCDPTHTLEPSSALSSTLSLIPGNAIPYLALGIGSAFCMGYAIRYNLPAVKLDRLNTTLRTAEETLDHAKAKCVRDYLSLAELRTRFLRTKLTTSKLQTRLLEVHDLGWKDYLQNIIAISRCLVMLEREVCDIQKTSLVLIEAAHRRKLTEDINETQAVLHGAMYQNTESGYEV